MAFTYTKDAPTVFGNKRIYTGTFSQASGDTGGDIVTGCSSIQNFQATGGGGVTKASISGQTVTLTTTDPVATVTGYWMCIGA